MPIFIDNNILVVTKDELVPRFYSYDNLKKQLFRHQDKPTGIKRYSRGGGSGRRLLVLFDSLPATIRESLGDPRRVEHILLLYFNTDAAAVEFYSNIYEDAGGKLSTEEQERYVMNASVLNALLALREARLTEWQSRGRRSMYGLDDSVWSDYSTFGKVLEEKFGKTHTLPPSRARLLEKMRKYAALDAEERYRFLVNKNRGNNSAGIRTEKARALLESMFAHQSWKPDAAEVFRQYEAFLSGYVEVVDVETGEVFDPKGYGKISQRTVSGFLSSWESGVATSRRRTGNVRSVWACMFLSKRWSIPDGLEASYPWMTVSPPSSMPKESVYGSIAGWTWEARRSPHGFTAPTRRASSRNSTARWYATTPYGVCRFLTSWNVRAT